MPADSGWYWCDTDSYQTVTHVSVENLVSMMDIVTAEMRAHHTTESKSVGYNDDKHDKDHVGDEKRGNADQLQVYETYQNRWQDKQKLKQKMLDDLESIIASYLRPVNLQLEDIYKRLSTLEKRVNQ